MIDSGQLAVPKEGNSAKMSSLTSDDKMEERADSGLGSLGPFSAEMSAVPDQTGYPAPDQTQLNSMDLGNALSKINIVEEVDEVDSGIFLSSVGHSSLPSTPLVNPGSTEELHQDVDTSTSSHDARKVSENTGGDYVTIEQLNGYFVTNQDGDNKLNVSIIQGRTSDAMDLIDLAQDFEWLNMQNTLWQTPLHLAVLTKQSLLVRRLICAGASVLTLDHWGNTPLHCACALGNEDTAKHFLVPVRYEETRGNRYRIPFQRLPQSSKMRNYEGDTCLHVAMRSGNMNVIRMLLETGADPNVGDGKSGRTVLHHAAELGNKELVKMLISKRRVDLNALDYAMRTPAQLAYGRLQLDIVRLLQRHGSLVGVFSDNSDNDWHEQDMECRYDASG